VTLASHVYKSQCQSYIYIAQSHAASWGTGIKGLMGGMATLPQGNQELLVVRDIVGRPQVSVG